MNTFVTSTGEHVPLTPDALKPGLKAIFDPDTAFDPKNYEDKGIDFATFDKEAEIAKFKDFEALGWNLYVRLYTEPQKIGSILIPDKARDEAIYNNFIGLVIQLGKSCYTDARYEHSGPWCKVGDWVIFPRHAGYRIFVGGTPIWVLKEDAVDIKVNNTDLISITSKYRY